MKNQIEQVESQQHVTTEPIITQGAPVHASQVPLLASDIARSDRDFLRSQERDRMNERGHLWTLFVSLATGFGVIGSQGGQMVYLVLLFPVLLAFVAMHIRNSEDTLKQIRKYLYRQEQAAGYQGYEHFSRDPANTRASHGGYRKALRGAFCTTGAIALGGVILHMVLTHVTWPIIPLVILIEGAVIAFIWCSFSTQKKKQQGGAK